MTSPSPQPPPAGAPTLCLGDPIVEFVGERPVAAVSEADPFVPRLGGSVANVAVVAARYGAHVALAGGAGDDPWGFWLGERLARSGVGTEWFELVTDAQTPVGIVTASSGGEPSRQVYGERITSAIAGGGDRLEDAVRASAALFIRSGGAEDNDAIMRAREVALSLERPVVFDARITVERWRSRAEAAAAANACVPDALLVCAGQGDAALMTGEDDPERAALALLKAGARMVVLTLGVSEGAMLRGQLRLDVDYDGDVDGDVLTGLLLARLATSAFYPSAVAASLPEAVALAARGYERGE